MALAAGTRNALAPTMHSQEAGTADVGSHDKRETANGAPGIAWKKFASRAKEGVTNLPSNLEDLIKENPYKTMGMVAAAGVGLGILLSSRIMRAALTSAVSYALVELTRAYLRERMARTDAAPFAASQS
jgi:hypothetical protein